MHLRFSLSLAALFAMALPAWADHDPHFDQDAKPLLRQQPHLLSYVEHNFEVRDTGRARVPGDDGRPPIPPFLFQARPRGTNGAFFITLLIEPGPQGRILKVIDTTRPGGRPPGLAGPSGRGPIPTPVEEPGPGLNAFTPSSSDTSASPPTPPPGPTAPNASGSSQSPPEITSATPSGPIPDNTTSSSSPSNSSPTLAPPADPAPPQ